MDNSTKETLCGILNEHISNIISTKGKERSKKIYNIQYELCNEYSFPNELAINILTLRQDLDELGNYYLFCLALKFNVSVESFFDNNEIKSYTNKIKNKTDINLIKLPALQVDDKQWIFVINVNDIISMYRSGKLINDTMINGRPQITNLPIKQLYNYLKEGTYVPNMITLSVKENKISYDSDTKQLSITAPELYIIDGYKRIVAFSGVSNEIPINFNVEIRLLVHDIERIKHFVWQERQYSRRVYYTNIKSFNVNSYEHKLMEKIKSDYICRDLFVNILNEKYFSDYLSNKYLSKWEGQNDTEIQNQIVILADIIIGRIKELLSSCPDIFNKEWSKSFTYTVFYIWEMNYDTKDTAKLVKRNKDINLGRNINSTKNIDKIFEYVQKKGIK